MALPGASSVLTSPFKNVITGLTPANVPDRHILARTCGSESESNVCANSCGAPQAQYHAVTKASFSRHPETFP